MINIEESKNQLKTLRCFPSYFTSRSRDWLNMSQKWPTIWKYQKFKHNYLNSKKALGVRQLQNDVSQLDEVKSNNLWGFPHLEN